MKQHDTMWSKSWLACIVFFILAAMLTIANGKCSCCEDKSCAEPAQWQCNNGDFISNYELCDGVKHCNDGSDETVEHCLNLTCPSYAFRCTYGACIQGSLRCNGHKDCMDGSDEMSYYCTSHDYQQIQLQWQGVCRNDMQLQCDSGECINIDLLCDGTRHCADGSDETAARCNYVHCPVYAFRCGYGGCVPGTVKCDGIKNCADGSDEFDSICNSNATNLPVQPDRPNQHQGPTQPDRPQDPKQPIRPKPISPSLPTSPIVPTTFDSHEDEEVVRGGCVVPVSYEHLLGVEDKTRLIARRGERLPNGTLLKFYCTRGWYLEGSQSSRCKDGQWIKPLPQCNRNCSHIPLTRGISTQASCSYGGKPLDCAYENLPVGTRAHISCAPGYYNDDTIQEPMLTCDTDAEWDFSRFKCKPVCGHAIKHARRKPWEVSIFRRSVKPIFEFVCNGIIISPKIVLTAANCLRLPESNKSVHEPIYYNVLEGLTVDDYVQSTNSFVSDVHNVSEIILPHPDGDLERQLALFILVHHFHFTTNLNPICFDEMQMMPLEPVLEVPANLASNRIDSQIGTAISNGDTTNAIADDFIFYLSGVVSEKKSDGALLLLRVHYYKHFLIRQLQRYYYLL